MIVPLSIRHAHNSDRLRACATQIIVPLSVRHAHNSYRFHACAAETCLMHVQIIQHVKIMEDDF